MVGVSLLLILGIILFVMTTVRRGKDSNCTYIIKKGRHHCFRKSSILRLRPFAFFKNTLSFSTIILSDGCDYDPSSLGSDAADINKLYGVSYGFDPHWNSLRLGWRYNSTKGLFEIMIYCYIRGKRTYQHILNVRKYEAINMSIYRNGGKVHLAVNGDYYSFKIDDAWIRFKMFPYFGGNKKSPNDMEILILDRWYSSNI